MLAAWLLGVGLVAGLLTRALVHGAGSPGTPLTLLLGVAGAALGGLIARLAAPGTTSALVVGASVGAVLLLLSYEVAAERGAAR